MLNLVITEETILDRIRPEYRHIVRYAARVFLSGGVEPTEDAMTSNETTRRWFTDMVLDILGPSLVKEIGLNNLWSYCYVFLANNDHPRINWSNGRVYWSLKPVNFRKKHPHTRSRNWRKLLVSDHMNGHGSNRNILN